MKKPLLIFTFLFILNSLSLFSETFTKAGIQIQIPPQWSQTPPTSSMRAGEWKIPRSSKDSDDGEFVIFYFGIDQGGDTQSNINRWKNQVTNAQGAPAPSEITSKKIKDLLVTQIRSTGTYTGMSALPGVPPAVKSNYGFIGIVVEGGSEGNLFLRFTGPEALIKNQTPQIQKLIDSLTLKKK